MKKFLIFVSSFVLGGVVIAYSAQVQIPVLSPPSKVSTRYLGVSITTGTPGATLRYTLDESEPTPISTIYTTPLQLGTSTTIRARAWKDGWNPSDIAEEFYTVAGKVSAGDEHVLALKLDGSLLAWGLGTYGRLGLGTTDTKLTPTIVPNFSNVIDAAAGTTHSIAVKADGSVWTWGYNNLGQLGDNTTVTRLAPVQVRYAYNYNTFLTNVANVAAGNAFSVARKTDKTVWAWGNNANGQLGVGSAGGSTPAYFSPVIKSGGTLNNIDSIAAGASHVLAADSSGNVWAWGLNTNGRLGDGTIATKAYAVSVLSDVTDAATGNVAGQPLVGIVEIAAGAAHSVAVDNHGYVWSWGLNTSGQLGDGTVAQRARAVRMKSDAATLFTGAVHVSAGANFTLITKSDGTVWACGENTNSSLGIGISGQQNFPKQVINADGSPLIDTAFASAGTDFGIALSLSGEISTWGSATNGHLGNNTTTPSLGSATQLPDLTLANHNPSISLAVTGSNSAPANNVSLIATVSDPDNHPISQVDFYFGEALIGTVTQAPYSFALSQANITNLEVGRYGFRAVATDVYRGTGQATAYHTVNPPAVPLQNVFFRRGQGSDPSNYSLVAALDFEQGKLLSATGFNPQDFPNALPWMSNISFTLLRQFAGWASTPGSFYYTEFSNPLVAFGSSVGNKPLYTKKEYRFGVQCGGVAKDQNGNYLSFPQFQISAYKKSDGTLMGTKSFTLPIFGNPQDTAKWESFVQNGFSWPTPQYPDTPFYGLTTEIKIIQLDSQNGSWGTSYPGYIITHESASDEYGYIISGQGSVPVPNTNPTQFMAMSWPAALTPAFGTFMPLYTMDFEVLSPWQSEVITRPQFQGKPMPSQYVGKSALELLNEQGEISFQPAINPNSYKVLNQSSELRRHSTLDQLVTDLTNGLGNDDEKLLALSNFVLNEIELADPFGYNEKTTTSGGVTTYYFNEPSINPGGVQRGAYATYMEGQGSPVEQCALLVYLLRQANIPATYMFPEHDKLLMLDARLSTMFGFQVRGILNNLGIPQGVADPNAPSLIPTNYPWVTAYINGKWVHIFPWMKDVEVTEGYDLYSMMPTGYQNAHQWLAKYLQSDPAIFNLMQGNDDTPADLFPRFIDNAIRQNPNLPNLSLEDVGVQVRQRKKYYTSLEELPAPFSLTGQPTVVESLSSKPEVFDTAKVIVQEMGASAPANNTITTADLRLLDLHNRKFLIVQTPYSATSVNVKLTLNPFDDSIAGTGTFDGTFANMGKAQSLALSSKLGNIADRYLQLSLEIKRHHAFFDTLPPNATWQKWAAYMGYSETAKITSQPVIKKGDLAAVCINYGKVSQRMLDIHAKEFWKNAGTTNIAISAGSPIYLMGMSYYKRLSDFNVVNYNLHKAKLLGCTGVGLSVMGAKLVNGILPSGNISLEQPYVDMFLNITSSLGSNTIHPDSGDDGTFSSFLDANVMYIANISAQEHAVINYFFKQTGAASTVKLLQIANKNEGNLYPGKYLTLNYSNYMQYDATMTGYDSGVWTKVKDIFQSAEGKHVTAYITSKPVNVATAEYTGMGALLLGRTSFAALISKKLNGAWGAPTPIISSGESFNIYTGQNNRYFVSNIPPLSSYATPIKLAPSTLSYNTGYQEIKAAFSGAFQLSNSQQNYVNYASQAVANFSLSGLTPSAAYGKITQAIKDQGFLGVGFSVGASLNWAKDPVNVMAGAFYHDEVDLTLPGPMPLQIRRNYNSKGVMDCEFGYGWKIAMMPYLAMPKKEGATDSDPISNPTTDIYAAEMDGSVIIYTKDSLIEGQWRPDYRNPLQLPPPPLKNSSLSNILDENVGSQANLRNAKIFRTGTTLANTVYTLYSPDGSERAFKVKSYPIPGTLPSGVTRINRKRAYLDTWKDNRGNSFTFTYGENSTQPDYGLLKRISSSNGMFIGFNYDAFGHIVEAYTSDGRWLYYGYNQYGDLENVTRPDGSVLKYEYKLESQLVNGQTEWTSTHLVSREIKPDGQILENDYDSQGRVTAQRATVGEGSALVVNGKFEYYNIENTDKTFTGYTLVKDAFDRATRYDYTASEVTQITDPASNVTSYDWFTANEEFNAGYYLRSLQKIVDPRGLVTEFQYDSNGNLWKKIITGDVTGDGSPDVATITTLYNTPNGMAYRPTEITDPIGNKTVFTYGNVAQPYLPTSIERKAGANTVSTTIREYVDTGSGSITAKGVLKKETVAAGSTDAAVTEYENDSRGYPTKITHVTGTNDPDVITNTRHNLRGELVEETSAFGRKNAYAYDAMGRRIWEERRDESGALAWWNYTYYDGNGEVTWIDGPRYYPEDYIARSYDGGGRLIQETTWRSQAQANGNGVEPLEGNTDYATVTNKYNSFGDLTKTVDVRGFATTMTYDDIGRMLNRYRRSGSDDASPIVSSESFTYEPGGKVGTYTNPLGGVTTNLYTQDGKPKKRIEPDQGISEWRYQLDGRVTQELLSDTNCWWTAYDDVNRTVTRTLKTSGGTALATEVKKYDRRGNCIEETDALGNVFTKSYDGLNRIKASIGSAGDVNDPQRALVYTYDAAGKVIIETNALNESTVTTTDVVGRPTLIEIKDAGSSMVNRTAYSYRPDQHGYTIEKGSGAGSVKTTIFTDIQGREVIHRNADNSFSLNRFDKAGNLLLERDALAREITRTYDALNHLDVETLPGGAVVNYDYDALGNLFGRTMPGNLVWSATYDNASRKLTEKLQNGAATTRNSTYQYYTSGANIGKLWKITDPRGVISTHDYDSFGRLWTVMTAGSQPEHAMTITYGYNTRNDLTSIAQTGGSQQNSTVTRTPGIYGDISNETITLNGLSHSAFTQYRDAAGRRVKFEPTGVPANARTFAWRADGLLSSTAFGGTSFSYTYGNNGLPIERNGADRSRTVAQRDIVGRPTSLVTKIGATPVLTETLIWRNDSTLDSYGAQRVGTGAWNETRGYQYDAAKRLITEPYTPPGLAASSFAYAFDFGQTNGLGVRTLANVTGSQPGNFQVPVGQVDSFGRIAQETGTGWSAGTFNSSYDAAGNVVTRSIVGDSTQTLKWDGLNRLTKVEKRDGFNNGYDWTAHYDGLGRRLKTAYQAVSAGTLTGSPVEIASAYDPEIEFLEVEARQGANTWVKFYGPDGESTYGSQQGVGGLEAVISSGGVVSVPINDYFGNLGAWVSGGTANWSTVSRSLGYSLAPGVIQPIFETNPTNYTGALNWQGRRMDATGLYWLGARYYQPTGGRFVSTDPLGHGASMSLYDYASGDPINNLDPDGRVATGFKSGRDGSVSSGSSNSWAFNAGLMVGAFVQGYSEVQQTRRDNFQQQYPTLAKIGDFLAEASSLPGAGVGIGMVKVPSLPRTVSFGSAIRSETQFLYRGVPAGTERYQQALQGIVKPRGTALDPISLRMHVLGEDVAAGVTSWTTNPAVAARFAGSEGKILKISYNNVLDRIVPRPFVGGKHAAESEILLKGTLNGL